MSRAGWTDLPLTARWLGARRMEILVPAGDWLGTYVEPKRHWYGLGRVTVSGAGEITAGGAGVAAERCELEAPAPGVAVGVMLAETC